MYPDFKLEEFGSVLMTQQTPRINGFCALDLGIGEGLAILPLAFSGITITGVDSSHEKLVICQNTFKESNIGHSLRLVCSDALAFLRAIVKKFDVVSMSNFLMYVTKTKGREIIRLSLNALAPQGYIWIVALSTSNEMYFDLSKTDPVDTDSFIATSPHNGTHIACFYHPNEIEEYLKSLGAKIIFSTETKNRAGAMVNVILGQRD